jgi:putative ABC transport system permease protein
MLAIAAVGTGVGAFGLMYLHGADQVVLNSTMNGATVRDSGLTLVDQSGHGYPAPLLAALTKAPRPSASGRWFGRPIVTQLAAFVTATSTSPSAPSQSAPPSTARTTFTFIPRPGKRLYLGTLISRTGACAHLDIVRGRCSLKGGGVVVSTRTAGALGLQVGEPLAVDFSSHRAAAFTVRGIYVPGTDASPYWWGQNFFPFGTYSPAGAYEHIDDVFASAPTVRRLAPVSKIYPIVQAPFEHGTLSVGQVGAFEQSVASFEQSLAHAGIGVGTRLFDLLSHAGSIERRAGDVVEVVDVELALLAVFVLYFVSSRTAAEREPDVRLAELRGYRPRRAVALALAEPVVVVALSLPVGFFAAWLAGALAGPAIFGNGIAVGPTPAAVVAAAAAGLVGVLAAALGARRTLVAGADGSLRQGGAIAAGSRWSAVLDAVVVAAAGAAFFELVLSGESATTPHPLAALAPGLLAVGVGIVVARALPRLLALTHRRSAYTSRIPLALAFRLVARRREFAAQVLVVTFASALAIFAICGWAIATTNRAQRASFDVGAATVLRVSVLPGTTFLTAVRRADPTGREAMAAVMERSNGETTLAVDASRLASVATWPSNLGMPASVATRRLEPPHVSPPVIVRGTSVEMTVDDLGGPSPAPDLALDLFDRDTQTPEQVTFGPARPGTHVYRGSLSFLCPGGCRLVNVAVSWTPPATTARAVTDAVVPLEVDSIAERGASGSWTRLRAGLNDPGRWTGTPGANGLHSTGTGLSGVFRLRPDSTPVTVAPTDVPRALPVLVTPGTAALVSDNGTVAGLDGAAVTSRVVGEVPALPGVGTEAVLADLHTAELFLSGPFTGDVPEVWLAKGAPSGIIRRLHAEGVTVSSIQTAAAEQRVLAHDGFALAYLLYAVSTAAAGLLLLGAVGFAMIAAARRRRDEMAALKAVGIEGGSLVRAMWLEQGLVFGVGLVTGVATGLVAAALALRSLPEFASPGAGLPLDLGLPPWVVATTIGVLAVMLGWASVWNARAVVRSATPERLGAA